MLALLLAEAALLTERRDEPPLLLLDDVLSELDPQRRRVLLDQVAGGGQTLITATTADALPGEPAQLLEVSPGAVVARRAMDGLDGEIREVLSRFGPQAGMPELLAAWPAAVGPMVAANAWPARIARDGTLHVNTSSSAWAFELGQLAPEILERLSEKLGDSAPKALRFAVGHLPEPAAEAPAQARTAVPEPTAEALRRAAELAAGIEDEELRKRVAKSGRFGPLEGPVRPPFLIHCTAARK